MDKTRKCKHAGCGCVTTDGKDYCSDRCKDTKKIMEITCQCNHPECKGQELRA